MGFYIWFDTILLRWFIVNMKGSEVRIPTYFSLKDFFFILATISSGSSLHANVPVYTFPEYKGLEGIFKADMLPWRTVL